MIDYGEVIPEDGGAVITYIDSEVQQNMTSYGFIILPFIEQDTLLKLLMNVIRNRKRLSHKAQQYLCAEVVRSLAHLHNTYQIAHLDLKPDNIGIWLNAASQIKTSLIDFGSSAPLTA
jgi:serine/threonine protein kinase